MEKLQGKGKEKGGIQIPSPGRHYLTTTLDLQSNTDD